MNSCRGAFTRSEGDGRNQADLLLNCPGIGPTRTVTFDPPNGWLTRVHEGVVNYASSISYHANGMVNQVAHGNSVTDTYGKDPNDIGRPSRISTSNALANWDSGSFEYDGAGNVKAMRGMSEPVARPTATRQQYTYDAFANLIRIDLNGVTYQDVATSTSTNRLTASGYDASGNMSTWGGYTYGYDALDAMATLLGGTLNKAYRYDADGERVGFREGASGPWTYALRGLDGKVLREYSYNGSSWSWGKDYVYRGGLLLAEVDSGGTKNFTLDHLGTPRLITDASRNSEYHAYWGYGQEIDTAVGSERMKFTGHERDDPGNAGALDYMHARYYNPTIGRFLAVDQGNGKPEAPGSWNRYAYSQGNPAKYVDADGRVVVLVLGVPAAYWAGAALVSAATTYVVTHPALQTQLTSILATVHERLHEQTIAAYFSRVSLQTGTYTASDLQRERMKRQLRTSGRDEAVGGKNGPRPPKPGDPLPPDAPGPGYKPRDLGPSPDESDIFRWTQPTFRLAIAAAILLEAEPMRESPILVQQPQPVGESPLGFAKWEEEQMYQQLYGSGPLIATAPGADQGNIP
jgi:RHS repeat-associated protein